MELSDCWRTQRGQEVRTELQLLLYQRVTQRVYSFLGYVDLLGTTYSSPTIATGYGAYFAQPLLRKAVEGRETTLTEEEARKILQECMKVLFYRDARSLNKVSCVACVFDRCLLTRFILVSNCHHHRPGSLDIRIPSLGNRMGVCRGHPWIWCSNAVNQFIVFVVTEQESNSFAMTAQDLSSVPCR